MNVLTDKQVADVPDSFASALDAGFALLAPDRKDEYAMMVADVEYKSMANLVVLQELMAEQALDPSCSLKMRKEIAEFNYKVSGMAARQVVKEQVAQGAGFSININIPGTPTSSVIVDSTAVLVDE